MSNLLTLLSLPVLFFLQGYDPRMVTRVTFPTCLRALFFVICEFILLFVPVSQERLIVHVFAIFRLIFPVLGMGTIIQRLGENASCHHSNASTKVSELVSVTESGSKTESTLQRSISLSNSILCLPRRL